jgi:hypothetical protein
MSLKGDKYETAEEVKFRLEGTVVLYDGKPVVVTRVRIPEDEDRKEIARVFFKPLPYGKNPKRVINDDGEVVAVGEVRKYLSSKKFDLAPFKMGYFNHNGEATFASRIPNRQNKQGLSQATCAFINIRGKQSQTMNFNTMLTSQGFVDMVEGKFPSFAEIGDMIGDKENASVAVSRSFAFLIDNDLEALLLMNKGVKCGIALKGQKALNLPPKFHFLREELEDCRIPLS